MAGYPSHLVRPHRLFDGRAVTIRPVRPDDLARMQAFLSGLSGETLYRRFQKWIGKPSEQLARHLTHVDYDSHFALVCLAGEGDGPPIIGDARYNVNPDGVSCDFGIMVAEAWHSTGVAGLLMDTLIREARARGLKRMDSLVLATNSPMLRFARGLGFTLSVVPEDLTTVYISKALQP